MPQSLTINPLEKEFATKFTCFGSIESEGRLGLISVLQEITLSLDTAYPL